MNGSEVRKLKSQELGIPPKVICVFHDNQLVASLQKVTLHQGAFLRVEHGLVGGDKTPNVNSWQSWETPRLLYHNRPLMDTPNPMRSNEQTAKPWNRNGLLAIQTKPRSETHTDIDAEAAAGHLDNPS